MTEVLDRGERRWTCHTCANLVVDCAQCRRPTLQCLSVVVYDTDADDDKCEQTICVVCSAADDLCHEIVDDCERLHREVQHLMSQEKSKELHISQLRHALEKLKIERARLGKENEHLKQTNREMHDVLSSMGTNRRRLAFSPLSKRGQGHEPETPPSPPIFQPTTFKLFM